MLSHGNLLTMCLTLSANLRLVATTRQYVSDLLNSVLKDEDAKSRVALTVHELLENGMKYASDGVARLEVLVASAGESKRVHVRTRNRARPERLLDLGHRIQALSMVTDPSESYLQLMLDSSERDGSGLGLGRVCAEGEMQLSYTLEGDTIIVQATTLAT